MIQSENKREAVTQGRKLSFNPVRRWRERKAARRRGAFAQLVQDALRELSSADACDYDADAFSLVETCSGRSWSLEEGYLRHLQSPATLRAEIAGRIAQTILETPLPALFSEAAARLRLQLESHAAHELARCASPTSCAAAMPIAEGLFAALYYEGSRRNHACSAATLLQWAVEPAAALAVALGNLQARQSALVEGPAGVFRSPPEDPAGSTLFCSESVIRAHRVQGEPVAMVPAHGVLLVTGSQDSQGLAAMAELALQSIRATRTLCATPFLLTDSGWTRFRPNDGALAARLRRVEIPLELQDYCAQRPVLEVALRKRGARARVAEAHAARDEAGQLCTWCAWTEAGEALLPRTDFIVFARNRARNGLLAIPWEVAAEQLADLMPAADCFPVRAHVSSFPSQKQLLALARHPHAIEQPTFGS